MSDLESVEINPEGSVKSAVIWMHGLGADGNDFVGLLPDLQIPRDAGIRFVFPHAPIRPVTLNDGMSMRAWYDIYDLSSDARQDEEGIAQSRAAIERLIEREVENGIPSERIALAGFSQGGAMALDTGLRCQRKLAGILALSTWLPLADQIRQCGSEQNKSAPILMAHGTDDPVVRIEWSTSSRDALREMGYEIEWHEYPMQHSLCLEEVEEVSKWIRRVLSN